MPDKNNKDWDILATLASLNKKPSSYSLKKQDIKTLEDIIIKLNSELSSKKTKHFNNFYLYSELNDLLKKLRRRRIINFSRKDEVSVESFLKISTQLEGLLPSITEQCLKDIIIRFREEILAIKIGEEESEIRQHADDII